MSADGGATTASSRQFVLEKESELRVEVGPESPLRLRLTAGAAEVFGAELPPGKWINVPALQNIAVKFFPTPITSPIPYFISDESFTTVVADFHLEGSDNRIGWNQRG